MAEATQTQPEIPAYTILLQLTQEEAKATWSVLSAAAGEVRRQNSAVYEVLEALERVLEFDAS